MAQTGNEHVAKSFLNALIPEGTTASTKENSKNTHMWIVGNAEMNLQRQTCNNQLHSIRPSSYAFLWTKIVCLTIRFLQLEIVK